MTRAELAALIATATRMVRRRLPTLPGHVVDDAVADALAACVERGVELDVARVASIASGRACRAAARWRHERAGWHEYELVSGG